MVRGWIAEHGDVAWELDALESNVLVQVIKEAIEENVDKVNIRSKGTSRRVWSRTGQTKNQGILGVMFLDEEK